MADKHPITPPPELLNAWGGRYFDQQLTFDELVTEVYKAGADQELKACCEWIKKRDWTWTVDQLRAARRSKPLSLKEQALEALNYFEGFTVSLEKVYIIRRALEQLNG